MSQTSRFFFCFILSSTLFIGVLRAQTQPVKVSTFGKGIVFEPEDESFSIKVGMRFQTLYVGELNLDNDVYSDQNLIRRARLKFDGFAYSPKLKFKVELGLTNRDTRNSSGAGLQQNSATANIILDAVLKYNFVNNWEVWFGQTKNPGNRERVISSQKLQFVDRSIVNSRFNLDRDVGIHLLNKSNLGEMVIKQHFSITMGEGRNITQTFSNGYDYTGRIELLPFGEFTDKGDYFGSDLSREPSPKFSLGATLDLNDGTVRSRGQLGGFVYDLNDNLVQNDLKSVFVDAMFKSNGFSFASEFVSKRGNDNVAGFGTGDGFVAQAGYLFSKNIEPAFRFSRISADNDLSITPDHTQYTFGLSKYISGHNLKIQTDLSYSDFKDNSNELLYRFQVELSF